MMLDTAFYREKLNENRFVIFIYYECRYAQFALSSRSLNCRGFPLIILNKGQLSVSFYFTLILLPQDTQSP